MLFNFEPGVLLFLATSLWQDINAFETQHYLTEEGLCVISRSHTIKLPSPLDLYGVGIFSFCG